MTDNLDQPTIQMDYERRQRPEDVADMWKRQHLAAIARRDTPEPSGDWDADYVLIGAILVLIACVVTLWCFWG